MSNPIMMSCQTDYVENGNSSVVFETFFVLHIVALFRIEWTCFSALSFDENEVALLNRCIGPSNENSGISVSLVPPKRNAMAFARTSLEVRR